MTGTVKAADVGGRDRIEFSFMPDHISGRDGMAETAD